jgi:hypothetical protein
MKQTDYQAKQRHLKQVRKEMAQTTGGSSQWSANPPH